MHQVLFTILLGAIASYAAAQQNAAIPYTPPVIHTTLPASVTQAHFNNNLANQPYSQSYPPPEKELNAYSDSTQYNSFSQFILEHIKYPAREEKYRISGDVTLRLFVNGNISIDNIVVIKKHLEGFNKEALRVAKLLPGYKFQLGNSGDYTDIPITFMIDSNGVKKISIE